MKLVVGLGNIGERYQDTRHNVGFSAIKTIADKYKVVGFVDKFDGKMANAKIDNDKVLLFMPMTYMNNSGIPLSKIVNFYKIAISDIYVIYDDMDIKVGRIKIKQLGSNAGHNGLKSIDSYVGKAYNKIRIGIEKPPITSMISNYVLGKFASSDQKKITVLLDFIAENINMLLNNDFVRFLNLYYLKHL
jgi:PTH1 family peptidyl-tRNA hydrolase